MPFVACDAKQLEWRTILELAQDPIGIAEVIEGQDTHSLNEKAFQLPSRLIAKKYLFRTIYRGSGWAFANDHEFMHVSTSASFWDGVGEKFYKKYNGIDKCHNRWKDLVMHGKPIIGPLGREWQIPIGRDYHNELKIPWTILTNYPVQGTGADIMTIARISFRRRLNSTGWPVLLVSTVHDSIVVDCPSEYVQRVVNLFHQVFDDLIVNIKRLFGYIWTVPLECECKVGMNMKDCEEVKRNDLT